MTRPTAVRGFAACLVLLVCALAANVSSASTFSYRRLELFELALQSRSIVAGRITRVDEQTFEFSIESVVAGERPPSPMRVLRFEDWMCAQRWTPYEKEQRLLLFLVRGERGLWRALGAGNEGEMPLVDQQVLLRGYEIPGHPSEALTVSQGAAHSSRVPLSDLGKAMELFRSSVRVQSREGDSVGWASGFDSTFELAELATRLRADSITAKLWDDVYHNWRWAGPFDARRTAWPAALVPLSQAQLCALTPDRVPEFTASLQLKYPGYPCFGLDLALVPPAGSSASTTLLVAVPGRMNPSGRSGGFWVAEVDVRGAAASARLVSAPSELALAAEFRGPAFASALCVSAVSADEVRLYARAGERFRPEQSGSLWWARMRVSEAPNWRAVEPRAAFSEISERQLTALMGATPSSIGDVDGDGTPELAFAVPSSERQLYFLSTSADGSLRNARSVMVDATVLPESVGIGGPVTSVGDLDGDHIAEIAFAEATSLYDRTRSAIRIGFLNRELRLVRAVRITEGDGGFDGRLPQGADFGRRMAAPGDVDQDGVEDLLVSSDDGLWILFLRSDGTVRDHSFVLPPAREEPAGSGVVNGGLAALERTEATGHPRVAWAHSVNEEHPTVCLFGLDAAGRPIAW